MMCGISRPILKHLSRGEARAACVRAMPRVSIALAGATVRLDWRESDRNWPVGPDTIRVTLRRQQATLWVMVPGLLARQLMLAVEPALEQAGWPPADLAAVLLETALLPLLEHWERCTGEPVRLVRAEPGEQASDDIPPLLAMTVRGVHVRGTLRNWVLALGGPTQAVDALLLHWPVAPRPADALPMTVSVRLGVTDLPHAMLRTLRPGDAVLIERSLARADPRASVALMVVAGARAAAVERTGTGWRLTEPLGSGGWNAWGMTDVPTEDGHAMQDDPGQGQAGLDGVPVRLVFEAGRLEMTLAELRRLGPGAILETGPAASPLHVDILANGRRMGRGELIEVEGALAVRIITLGGLNGTAETMDATP